MNDDGSGVRRVAPGVSVWTRLGRPTTRIAFTLGWGVSVMQADGTGEFANQRVFLRRRFRVPARLEADGWTVSRRGAAGSAAIDALVRAPRVHFRRHRIHRRRRNHLVAVELRRRDRSQRPHPDACLCRLQHVPGHPNGQRRRWSDVERYADRDVDLRRRPAASASDQRELRGLGCQFSTLGVQSHVVSRLWTFGDGATATVANPYHVYAAAGTYTVSETVTDGAGRSSTLHP